MRLRACLMVAVVLGASPAFGQTLRVFDVSFDGDGWHVQPPGGRVTSRDEVDIRIRHFNFLRYTLSLDVADERAESYGYLTRLWATVLNPVVGDVFGALGALGAPADRMTDALVEASRLVYANAQEVQRQVQAALVPYTRPGLTTSEAEALTTAVAGVRGAGGRLRASYAALQTLVEGDAESFRQAFASSTKAYFKLAVDSYDEAISKSDLFLGLADRTLNGDLRRLGTRDAGTRVTVTLTAVGPDGARSDIQTIHYVSQSSMPLVFHGGVAFSGIRDVTFEKVRRAAQFSGQDFFAQQGSGAATGFSAFLAWQLFAAGGSLDVDRKQQPVGLLLSVGTDLSSLGSRLYLGPSVMLFGRLVATTGAAFGTTAEGKDPIEPDVFRIVNERGTATWFTALSVRLY